MSACYIPRSVSDAGVGKQSTKLTTPFFHGLYILEGGLDDKQIHNLICHMVMNMVHKRNQGERFREGGQEGFSEKETYEQRPEGNEEMSHTDI